MENLLPKPREMDFNAPNLAATWKKWKQNTEFYLTAVMRGKSEEEKYSVFLFLIGEQGRDIFNTMEWEKKVDAEGNETDEDNITVKELFKNFEEYCLPKKNLVVERRKFFWKNQHDDETFDQYMTELKNLASTCEFGELHDGLSTYKIVDGIRSEKIGDRLLRKGAEMTLANSVEGFTNQENVQHIDRNVANARRRIIGQVAVIQGKFMKHQLNQQKIL